jgi:hypothetical protein
VATVSADNKSRKEISMEQNSTSEEKVIPTPVFTNPTIQAMEESERVILEDKLSEIEKLPQEEQEELLKGLANPTCGGKRCYGRGYTGWSLRLTPLTEEEKALPEEEKALIVQTTVMVNGEWVEYKETKTPIACTAPRCAEHTYVELSRSRFLRKYKENKANKEAEKPREPNEETAEKAEVTD